MKKAVFSPCYGAQEIPEVNSLGEIEEAGTYAVTGYDRPVNVMAVTPYGESELSRQYPSAIFFIGADGITYCGMQCGEFAGGRE